MQTANTLHTTHQWYVVHCKPLKEWQAAAALEDRLGLKVYLPEVRRHFRGKLRRAPLFPRYLFLHANLQEVQLHSINATPGVLRLVSFGEMPQPVPSVVVETLRQRVERLNTQGGLLEHGFQPGQEVRIRRGPLQSLEAIFVGPMRPSERVRVLIEFLGRLNEVEVDVDAVEHVGPRPAPKRERRTRGKGRRIKNQ